MASEQDRMERIVALAKRRGFIFPGSEIYGGLNGFWDYGPLGVELKRNIKDAWWHDLVRCPPVGLDGAPIQMVGLDCSIIMNPKVWEASGHVGGFADPMVTCKECRKHMRSDQLDLCLVHYVDSIPDAKFESQIKVLDGMKVTDRPEGFMLHENSGLEDIQAALRRRIGSKRAKVVGRGAALFAVDGNKCYWLEREYNPDWSRLNAPDARCPYCGGELTREDRKFNLMFKSYAGAMEDSASQVYLRPETAQGIFANYKNVLDTTRLKIPFGIAQIGKAFRNEINPRNFTFRSREFEQMEIEFFCHPSEADKWYEFWRDTRFKWYVDQGLKSSKLRLRDHEKEKLAHYARACADVEYSFPFSCPKKKDEMVGFDELEGVANRTDFDLRQHQNHPACIVKDLSYFDDETKERFLPYVIEPSGGVDRALLAFLCEAYDEDEAPDENGKMQKRVVLRFHPRLAPIKVAVFPLVKKDGMPEKARAIYEECRRHLAAFYDEKGAVGRRYRRQDEAGTPFCVTVDGQTLEDGTVTIRDRDSMKQERIPAEGVLAYVRGHLRL